MNMIKFKHFHKSKLVYRVTFLLLSCLVLFAPMTAYADTPADIANNDGYSIDYKYNPKGDVVISAYNGQILYGYNIDAKWPPASMSKLMTLYLLMQEMDKGKVTYKTKVTVNDKYYGISKLPMLSNNNFRKGATYTVDELIQIMLTASSNSATFMLANLVDKDDSDFVDLMNRKANELGMTNTRFYNPAGPPNNLLLQYKPKRYLQDDDNISSSRDFAILCQHLVTEYPEILKYTSKVNVTVKKGTQDQETFGTYNHSLEGAKLGYKGVDGLKTGSSDTAGFNTAITGKQNNMRIIQIMLGVEDWYDPPAEFNRNKMANAIMDLIYSKYAYKKVLSKGVHKVNGKEIIVFNDLYDIVRDGQKGKLIYKNGKVHYEYDREFISKDYNAPTVKYEDYEKYKTEQFFKHNLWWIVMVSIFSIIAGIFLLIYYFRPHWFKSVKMICTQKYQSLVKWIKNKRKKD
ncbi:DUF1958 domain-containing protein [Macrococcus sp. DPC7161]|uniref:DUF1958 domain-containing protein n=1 Tax=Macrococcus sp. DPC7161 TaxID=2507060 RepID=UPI00100C0C80|nr:DUF1958 domain-containing protein [Macrococcus sp. DPC7161]RXK18616.1 D-alanyl-D-alanine carboxypeptidase [Macrococcus sp. DPC7161]